MTNSGEPEQGEELTAVEYIQQQQELYELAVETLPEDFSTCSFPEGHVKQRVYSCLTCASTEAGEYVGVCYSCFISCHTTHDVIELFERRAFQCDCGVKLKSSCNLLNPLKKDMVQNWEDLEANQYNDNFKGVFCKCRVQYDPESEESTMFQCFVCEDWVHQTCLSECPDEAEFEDLICSRCVALTPFLLTYKRVEGVFHPAIEEPVDVETEPQCPLKAMSAKVSHEATDLYGLDGWRDRLCRCDDCESMYRSRKLEFLVNPVKTHETTVDATSHDSLLELGMQQLQRMDREQAMNGVIAYNSLKDSLMLYLQDFKDRHKVVTKQDIDDFFELQSQKPKKPRLV